VSGLFGGGWRPVAVSVAVLVVVVGGAAAGAVLAATGPGAPRGHGGSAAARSCGAGKPRITETGTGTVSITPNLLTLDLDVHTTAAQASGALAQNDKVTAAVLHALSAGGVTARDLQTTDLTIQPNYANTSSKVTGYGVDNTVIAKIRTFSTAGTLIDAAVSAGGDATRINSLAFSLTQPLQAQARARDLAVRQAVSHARAIAASASQKIGGICSIDDQTSTSTTSPILPYANLGTAAPSAHVPVESGSETVTARVKVVFALG
jgi:uncharacterized protein